MAYNSRLLPRDTGPGKSSSIQTYPCGNTVGAVVSTAHAFRLADFTADRDSHPALKLCGRKYTILPVNKQGLSAKCAFPPLCRDCLCRDRLCRDRLCRDRLCRNCLCRNCLCRNCLCRNCLCRDRLCRDCLCRNCLCRDRLWGSCEWVAVPEGLSCHPAEPQRP